MASPQAEALKDVIRQFRSQVLTETPTVEQQRAAGDAAMEAMSVDASGVSYAPVEVGGVPGQRVTVDGLDAARTILYLHGGGYVIGSSGSHRKMVGHLCKAAEADAVVIDYRLAPEHPHPAAVDDAVAAYRALLDHGHAPSSVIVAGDSAGGGLTIATLAAIRDRGLPAPAGGLPMSPWVDLEGVGESMTTNAEADLMVGADALKMMADAYLQGQDIRQPSAAPLYADLRGLPPVYIQVGGDETLLDDSTRLASRAAAAGVAVRLDVFPEMQHVFQLSAGNMPEADEAIARAGTWIREHTST